VFRIVTNWLDTIKQTRSPETYKLYKMVITQMCDHCGHPKKWNGNSIADYLGWCKERGNSPSTRNTKLQVIRSFVRSVGLNISVPDKVPHLNPMPVVATEDDVRKLAKRLNGKYRLALLLMADAGLRESEVRHLRWENVDGVITVEGKGSKVRVVPIATERLKKELAKQRKADQSYVVPGSNGKPMTPSWLSRHIAETAMSLKLGRLTAHSFRHQFAARSARQGVPTVAIQQALGHSNLATTEGYLRSLVGDVEFLEEAYTCFGNGD